MNDLIALASEKFPLGAREWNLIGLIERPMIDKIREKFPDESPKTIATTLKELMRYLYLAAHSPRSVFFPGDHLMDELWHVLIIETASYRRMCERLKPGRFLDHSGVKFNDYLKDLGPEDVHQEQCSWLASYHGNFGPIGKDEFECLNLAKEFASRGGMSLQELNELGQALLSLSEFEKQSSFEFEDFLAEVAESSGVIDKDPALLGAYLNQLVKHEPILTNVQAEALFGSSTALAFTLMQHLAAVERLESLPEWQQRNPALWKDLSSSKVLCGLATTHLAKPGTPAILGTSMNSGWTITGRAPWVCGFQIFQKVLIGFKTETEVVFALVDFPNEDDRHTKIIRHQLVCLNGSATVMIEFKDYVIPSSSLVSRRAATGQALPRPTKYINPQIGIGKSALAATAAIVTDSPHPVHRLIHAGLTDVRKSLEEIEVLRKQDPPLDTLVARCDEFNRAAVRLLALASGSKVMEVGSHVARLQMEMTFLDSVVHAPAAMAAKIQMTCGLK